MAFLTSSRLRLRNYIWAQSQGKCRSRFFRVIIFHVVCFSFCFLCLMALGYGCPECSFTGKCFKFSRDLHCSLQNLEGDLIWHLCCEGEKQRNTEKCKPNVQKHEVHRGGSRIFFTRGCTRLLLYFNTNKPHSVFFAEYQLYWGGGGVCTPCTLPLDPPLVHLQ